MLQVKNISKSYTTGDFTQKALDGVSVNFRRNEFVSILGPSGSGKTTFLNCLGGLDKYDDGDLVINGKSTKDFTDSEWDSYRNNSIGFIFQSYNLITHLNVLDNVEMGMTLSGVPDQDKKKRALEALERVGLKEHAYKKPNQLSGGQMQRVAIARALANDPDIILADEPTGALDKNTSRQIMDLIKEIADDKLVIMVTHNPALAEEYSDRIVKFEDGKVIGDSNPYESAETDENYSLKKTSMSFRTALKLSGKNISTKKGRTILTALASSIGIIGIALILSLSDGFQIQIDKYQSNALNEFPIVISKSTMVVDESEIESDRQELKNMLTGEREFADTDYVTLEDTPLENTIHNNDFSDEFMDYLYKADPEICNSIGFTRTAAMNVLKKDANGKAQWHNLSTGISGITDGNSDAAMSSSFTGVGLTSYPTVLGNENESYLKKYYDVVAGSYPESPHDLVFVVDSDHTANKSVMESLGFDVSKDTIKFSDIIGTEYKLIGNDVFYKKSEYGVYVQNSDYDAMYNNKNNITLKISGVVRLKEGESVGLLGFGIAYSDELVKEIINLNSNSAIVKDIKTSKTDVTPTDPMSPVDDLTRESLLLKYGGSSEPLNIYLYPNDFETKDLLLEYLDKYNEGKSDKDAIIYTDMSATVTELTGSIMDAVTIVLVAFASISLVVSLIMITIITYTSVLERIKEIGILRALGARKKDISRVFNAETFITGIVSGFLGIVIAYILKIPINMIIYKMTELPNVAVLNPLYAIALVAISVLLTLIGGAIPAKMAANKDPVAALRTE